MNKIENLFKNNVFQRGGINLYSKDDALLFILECEKAGFSILGIDGFYLTQNTTQPSLENSIDFSILSLRKDAIFSLAKDFLANKDKKLFFEIIYDDDLQ